MSQIYGT